jgi:hypothetical protein
MKLFIIILLINCVYLFGDNLGKRITKKQLRGMYKQELERFMSDLFVKTFDDIYDKIIGYAKIGKYEYQFTIMCEEIQNSNCEMNKGHELWLQKNGDQGNVIKNAKPYITIEKYKTNLIDALHKTFPDTNITTINKNCCEYHIVQW